MQNLKIQAFRKLIKKVIKTFLKISKIPYLFNT